MGITARVPHLYNNSSSADHAADGEDSLAAGAGAGAGSSSSPERPPSPPLFSSSSWAVTTSPSSSSSVSPSHDDDDHQHHHLPFIISGSSNSSAKLRSLSPSSTTSTSSSSSSKSSSSVSTFLPQYQQPHAHSHHHYSPAQYHPHLLRRIVWGSVLIFCGLMATVTYQAFHRPRDGELISYTPFKARLGGVAVSPSSSTSVLGLHDCIAADMLIGGALGVGEGLQGQENAGEKEEEEESEQRIDEGTQPHAPPPPSTSTSTHTHPPKPIPMIATNLDYDTENYLTRFVTGINTDKPTTQITHKLIAWGGCDPMVASQVNTILSPPTQLAPDFHVYRTPKTLGCAAGWNTILTYMSMHEDIPWVIIFNTDIYTPPGSLSLFAEEIWAHIEATPNFCVGHFNTRGAGTLGRYTAFVYTRHALTTLGLFDANIYPAYYEDVELDIRMARAQAAGVCSGFHTFNSSEFVHGRPTEGRRGEKYVSGTKIMQQKMMAHGDEEVKALATEWAEKIKRGKVASQAYLAQKWGCKNEVKTDLGTCVYEHPFDDPRKGLSYWVLDVGRRRCLDGGEKGGAGKGKKGKGVEVCEYTLEEGGGEGG